MGTRMRDVAATGPIAATDVSQRCVSELPNDCGRKSEWRSHRGVTRMCAISGEAARCLPSGYCLK